MKKNVIIFTLTTLALIAIPLVTAYGQRRNYTDTDCTQHSDCPQGSGDYDYSCDTSINKCYGQIVVTVTPSPLENAAPNNPSNLTQGTIIAGSKDLPTYIANIYKFGVGIVAILAVVVIMWGGLIWIMAGGNTGQIDNAKQWIGGAVLGLVIALTSYVILNTINPQLINLRITKPGCVGGIDPATGKCRDISLSKKCCNVGNNQYTFLNVGDNESCKDISFRFTDASDDNLCQPKKLDQECILPHDCDQTICYRNIGSGQFFKLTCASRKCVPSGQPIAPESCGSIINY